VIDIVTTGTLVSSGWVDDDYGLAGNISWDFRFYGTVYHDIYVSENGTAFFWDDDTGYFGGDPIPDSYSPDAFIAPFWTDLNIAGNGAVFFQDFGDHFVLMWREIDYWGDGVYTFELICWEAPDSSTDSNFAFLYAFTPYDNYYAIGMQGDATTGTELANQPDPADFVVSDDWYLLTPDSTYFDDYAIEETTWGQIKAGIE